MAQHVQHSRFAHIAALVLNSWMAWIATATHALPHCVRHLKSEEHTTKQSKQPCSIASKTPPLLPVRSASPCLLCRKKRNGCGGKKSAPPSASRRPLSLPSQLGWKKINRRKLAPPTLNSSLLLPVLLKPAAVKVLKAGMPFRRMTHSSPSSSSSNSSSNSSSYSHRLNCRQLLCQLQS